VALHRNRSFVVACALPAVKDTLMHNLAVTNESVSFSDLAQRVEEIGFAVVPRCLDEVMVERLASRMS
jgi:hypothetical protein